GLGEPTRDWFPISFMSTVSDFADLIHGPNADWGQLSCGCHPNCGIGMAVMIEQLSKDIAHVNDAARGMTMSVIGVPLALLRNYSSITAASAFKRTGWRKEF